MHLAKNSASNWREPRRKLSLHMRNFSDYVRTLAAAFDEARNLEQPEPQERMASPVDAPRVLVFAPHPSDEVFMGGLALRLMRECGMRVVTVAVTLGNDKSRQSARQDELASSCRYLGFDCITADECGLEDINLRTRREDPIRWLRAADVLGDLIRRVEPLAIFYPHASDSNATYMGVHGLVNHALIRVGSTFSCRCFETEFWAPMEGANVLVELNETDVGDLVSALSAHAGEVSRRHYHLRLPAWLMDNVRRGSGAMSSAVESTPDFRFGCLYRLRRWNGRKFEPILGKHFILPADESPAALLRGEI